MEKTFIKMLDNVSNYEKGHSYELDSETANAWIAGKLAEKADPVNTKLEQLEKALADREDKLIDTITKAVATKTDKVWAKPKDNSDKSLSDFLRLVAKNDQAKIQMKYGSTYGEVSKGQNTQSGILGGFVVPVEYSSDFLAVAPEKAIVKPRAFVQPMQSNTMKVNALNQSTNQYGGVVLYYTEEGAEMTETTTKVRQMTLQTRDLTGICYVTNDQLSDGANTASIVTDQFRKALINREDKEYLVGAGIQGPLGAYNSAAALTATRTTTNRIKYTDLVNMEAKMLDDDNAVWVVSKGAQAEAKNIRDDQNRPIWIDSYNNAGMPTMLGRPVFVTGKTGIALGSQGDIALIDWSYYYVGVREDIMVSFSEHVKFTSNQMAYRIIYRHDGFNGLSAPIMLDDGSTQVSNVVLLAA